MYGSDRSNGATIVYPVDANGATLHTAGRVWPLALQPHRSPCRVDASKGLRQHRCSAHHAYVVEAYRSWRDGILAAAEEETHAYAGDERAYWREHDRPTFRAFLAWAGSERREAEDS